MRLAWGLFAGTMYSWPALDEVGLRFAVRDTGIGIPREQQERIFRAFEQEDTSTTRKYGGTGLGLTISARLVALMGGTITVQSEPGRGSTFAFTARFGQHPQPEEPVVVPPPDRSGAQLHNLPVLVVDDNTTNRHILVEWLHGWQMQPAAVGDPAAALDALNQAVARGQPYSLVLLDARMPEVDGLTLAGQIRQQRELSATRIIMLTSGDRPGDLARLRELRVDAHLLKPIQQDELLETICKVMSPANGNVPPAVRPAEEREQTRPRRPSPGSRYVSWWLRTMSLTPSSWRRCWDGKATACGSRTTAARHWRWRKRDPSTCCCWTFTCRNWTASRLRKRFASVSEP